MYVGKLVLLNLVKQSYSVILWVIHLLKNIHAVLQLQPLSHQLHSSRETLSNSELISAVSSRRPWLSPLPAEGQEGY